MFLGALAVMAGLATLNSCQQTAPAAEDTTEVAADSAPAKGLFLARVFWQPDEWKSYTPVLPPFALQAMH